jgi:L-rhamnose mutarotase
MAADPRTREWWRLTDVCQQPVPSAGDGEWWAPMEEVFHTDCHRRADRHRRADDTATRTDTATGPTTGGLDPGGRLEEAAQRGQLEATARVSGSRWRPA